MNKGIIVKINKALYFVKLEDNSTIICSIRGKIRNDDSLPLVGDFCDIEINNKTIENIHERRNKLIRPLVSNIDKVFIVVSTKIPKFSSYMLDKFLVLSSMNNIEPIIIITKTDLLNSREKKVINTYISYYRKIGYKVYKNTKLRKIKKEIKTFVVALAGQTGSGKSSLLNKLDKNLLLKTDEVSISLGRGKHTTRLVELIDTCGGLVADTPGFSSLELEIDKTMLKNHFIEFSRDCKYKSCNHINEDGCKVIKDVLSNKISKERYDNYIKMYEEVSRRK
ncbi:MAG: ribosome small subunit-dependent GTPase A [Bacilli bacterium]